MRTLLAIGLSAAAAVAQPSLLRLPAVADASADQDMPAVNFGGADVVTCGKTYTSTPTFRVWMTRGHFLFDVSSLAGLAPPSRVRLRLYQARSSAAGCLDVTLHRVTAPWSEATLTWQIKPAHDPTVIARVCVGDSFDPGFKSFDVTALVLDWLNGVHPNHGLLVRDPTESTAGAARPLHAASREAAASDQHPCLEVAWDTLPFGSGCGPTGAPVLDLARGTPAIGDAYVLGVADFARGATLLHMVGLSNTGYGGITLPLNLGFLGYPACSLLVAPDLGLAGVASSRGTAEFSFAIPNRAWARNLRFYHQVLGFDANLVLAFTNGFAVRTY